MKSVWTVFWKNYCPAPQSKILVLLFWCGITLITPLLALDGLRFSLSNQLEASRNTLRHERYFENWLELYAYYRHFRVMVRWEAHRPPQIFSPDTFGQGIYQRYIEFQNNHWQITLGNFYTLLGRGLLLHAREDRNLRWDTNIDGFRIRYMSNIWQARLFYGRPRDRTGKRLPVLFGSEWRIAPVRNLELGTSYLNTHVSFSRNLQLGSVFLQFHYPWMETYFEFASHIYPSFRRGRAAYLNSNLYLKNFTFRLEAKDYWFFHLTNGMMYDFNNPPIGVKEHLFTLMNRHQHLVQANNERGILLQATYSFGFDNTLTLNWSRCWNRQRNITFREWHGQLEVDYPEDVEWVWIANWQKDLEARYLNFVNAATWQFSSWYSLKWVYEHQHVRILLTKRQFYNQLLTISLQRSPIGAISFLLEHSTDQSSQTHYWLGAQLDVNVHEKLQLTVFGGNRRGGKICAGGICVYKPEFRGVEVTAIIRL